MTEVIEKTVASPETAEGTTAEAVGSNAGLYRLKGIGMSRHEYDTIGSASRRLLMWRELHSCQKAVFDKYVKEEKTRLRKYKQDINFLDMQIRTAKKRKMKTFHAPTFLKKSNGATRWLDGSLSDDN